MIVVSVAQATTRLGIDAKTLHRWLADAQLPLHRSPQDARQKEVSEEHLERLARLHQRRLTPLPQDPPAPEGLPLPAALLTMPEQLDALQTQLAALQQQVAVLTHLLPPHAHTASQPGGSGSAEREEQAFTQASASCSALSSCCLCHRQNAPQAGSCHPSR